MTTKIMAEIIVDRQGRKRVTLPLRAYEHLLEDLRDLQIVAARRSEKAVGLEDFEARLRRRGLLPR